MDIIKSEDKRFSEYAKLIVERDNVRKSANIQRRRYVNVFGELLTELFKRQISCIEKKKTIAYFQLHINHGEMVNYSEMKKYIDLFMKDYHKQLDEMIKEKQNSEFDGTLSEAESLEIRKIYRGIAKKIHPDLNDFGENKEIFEQLWFQVTDANERNDIEQLRELEVLVNSALAQNSGKVIEITIPDIEEKLVNLREQIKKIMETDPYMYMYLLDNDELVEEKKNDIKEQIREYEEYEKELCEILKELSKNGVEM